MAFFDRDRSDPDYCGGGVPTGSEDSLAGTFARGYQLQAGKFQFLLPVRDLHPHQYHPDPYLLAVSAVADNIKQ